MIRITSKITGERMDHPVNGVGHLGNYPEKRKKGQKPYLRFHQTKLERKSKK